MNTASPAPTASPSAATAWLSHHRRAAVSSLLRCLRRPWATLLTVSVMALALALPMGLSIALDNIKHFAGSVQQSRQISLFLHPDFSVEQARVLQAELEQRGDVAAIELRTPEQGLEELRQQAGMGAAIDVLDDNPLPSVLLLTPAVQADDQALGKALEALPQADLVQHDALWRQRLDGWLALGTRLVNLLSLVLGIGALLVVGNTVRLDILARREEIGVLQLLGASNGFIRRPFLYMGAWYGLGAGVLALLVWASCVAAIRPPLAALTQSYASPFVFKTLDALHSGLVLLGTTVIGVIGAWLVASHVLRQNRLLEG
ncbi:MAG: permease-like cell division protein FtsX [Stenotrophomonas sp.]